MAWKVSLHKVSEEEFALYPTIMDAVVAAQERAQELGIRDVKTCHLSVQQHPITGELLIIDITEVDNG